MTGTTTPVRLEFKYPVRAGRAHLLGLGLRRAYPDRGVSSLYFDTPDWQCFAESEEGMAIRAKLRVRTYTEGRPGALKLEVKRRDGRLGYKETYALGEGTLRDAVPRVRRMLPQLDVPRNLVPQLIVRYQRSYYTTREEGEVIRVTWDRDIGFSRPGLGSRPGYHHRRAEFAVVEVKGPIEHALATESVGRRLGLRRARFSKYALGVRMLVG